MQADLIFYAVVAAGLVFWLRSVLGTRHGEERERPNPFTQAPVEKAAENVQSDNISGLPLPDARLSLPRNVSVSTLDDEHRLREITAQDPQFSVERFCTGAQDAFAIIVEAFAAKDRDTLKNLLEPQVYAAFDKAITDRDASGETMATEIHAVRRMEILGVRTEEKTAYVKIRFIADETCVIRDRDGTIVSGDPDRITEMNDIWTFSRVLGGRDPRWFVHETKDGDVVEDHKTPLPDLH